MNLNCPVKSANIINDADVLAILVLVANGIAF
jgi:hypothetical protein